MTVHTIRAATMPQSRRNVAGTVDCSCGEVITAMPDQAMPDAWTPLRDAYSEHRFKAGAREGDPKPRTTPYYGKRTA